MSNEVHKSVSFQLGSCQVGVQLIKEDCDHTEGSEETIITDKHSLIKDTNLNVGSFNPDLNMKEESVFEEDAVIENDAVNSYENHCDTKEMSLEDGTFIVKHEAIWVKEGLDKMTTDEGPVSESSNTQIGFTTVLFKCPENEQPEILDPKYVGVRSSEPQPGVASDLITTDPLAGWVVASSPRTRGGPAPQRKGCRFVKRGPLSRGQPHGASLLQGLLEGGPCRHCGGPSARDDAGGSLRRKAEVATRSGGGRSGEGTEWSQGGPMPLAMNQVGVTSREKNQVGVTSRGRNGMSVTCQRNLVGVASIERNQVGAMPCDRIKAGVLPHERIQLGVAGRMNQKGVTSSERNQADVAWIEKNQVEVAWSEKKEGDVAWSEKNEVSGTPSKKNQAPCTTSSARLLRLAPCACVVCGIRCGNAKGLAIHMKIHSRERLSEGAAMRRFACAVCALRFKCNSGLRKHSRLHTGEGLSECATCGATFTTRGSLRAHERTHTGERPYACAICGARFTAASSRQIHMRIHTGEKPYACPTCGEAFSTKTNCRLHAKTHLGERPYACLECGARFTEKSSLWRHQERHERGAPLAELTLVKREDGHVS